METVPDKGKAAPPAQEKEKIYSCDGCGTPALSACELRRVGNGWYCESCMEDARDQLALRQEDRDNER